MNRTTLVAGLAAAVAVGVPALLRILRSLRERKPAGASSRGTAKFDEAVRKAGFGDRLEVLRAARRSSIRLRTRPPGSVAAGSSKIGGRPDLPAELAWPEPQGKPLPFFAQLALAELAPFDEQGLLPREGWLVFFAAPSELLLEVEDECWDWKVLHLPAGCELVPRELPAAIPANDRYAECGLEISLEDSLPGLESPLGKSLGLASGPATDAYEALQLALAGGEDQTGKRYVHHAIHRVLGWPDAVQADPLWESESAVTPLKPGGAERSARVARGAADWVLLLQVDSDNHPNTEFGDMGRVYFAIRRQDLAARAFDETWCVLQYH